MQMDSVIQVFETFDNFSKVSGLKVNKSKCEIAGIGSKNGAQEALSGIKTVNLNTDAIKILGVHFTYNGLKHINTYALALISVINFGLRLLITHTLGPFYRGSFVEKRNIYICI